VSVRLFRQVKTLFYGRYPWTGTRAVSCCIFLVLVLCASVLFAADNIVLVHAGTRDAALWNGFKKYLTNKGYVISSYEAADTMEKQVETANRINREKAKFMLVLELVPSDAADAFVAVSDAKKGKGMILEVDEVPGSQIGRSEELATSIAAQFQKKVKAIALFALLGIDMPGVFLRLDVPKDRPVEAFNKLHDGILNYMKRGIKDERERKGERRNTPP